MHINNFQKIISGLLIGLILYPQISLLTINNTYAVVPTATAVVGNTDPLTVKSSIESFIRTVDTKVTAWLAGMTWTEKILDMARKAAYAAFKAAILDRLVNALIAWINNDGKGSIVNNWDEFFENAKNIAAGEFARSISNGILCSPFNLQVQLTLMPVNTFDSVTCTLNDVVGNIDSFMGDFRNGSWLAYQEVWYPRNNFYGATIIGLNGQAEAQYAGLDAKKSEAQAGSGFLSFNDCKMVEDPKGNFTKEGDDISAVLGGNAAAFTGTRYKKDCRVATPGLVAGEAATQILVKTPLARIINADDLSLYLTAIFNASINRLTVAAKKGIAGLLADATKNTKINPVFPCAGLTGDGFVACMASVNAEKAQTGSYQNGTEGLTNITLDIRHQISDTLSQAISLQSSYVDSLTQLAACQSQAITPEIIAEQDLLAALNDQFTTNQTFLDALITPAGTGTAASTSVTPAELAQLGQLAAAAAASAGNSQNARLALNDAQAQLADIQTKVADKLPGIQTQLQSCPKLQLTPPVL